MRILVGGISGEIHHVPGEDVVIGGGAEADLELLDAEGVAARHVRVLARRGQLVIVDLGSRTGTVVRGELIRAPVVLAPGHRMELGAAALPIWAWPDAEDSPRPGDRVEGPGAEAARLGEERVSRSGDLRWFIRAEGAGLEQCSVPARAFEPAVLEAWLTRVQSSAARPSAYLAELVTIGRVRGRPCVVERLPPHVTLTQVDDALREGRLKPSLAFSYGLAAQLLEAVATYHAGAGPHGALHPDSFLLGLDGRLILRRPGPSPGDPDDEHQRRYLSPARRCGGPPSVLDDRFSLAALDGLGRFIPAGALVDTPLEAIARGLREGAVEAGLDPSAGQLRQVARLLHREPPNLARNHRTCG